MSTRRHGYSEDGLIALSDEELVAAIDEWIGRLDDDVASDALSWLVTEAMERFAPDVELARGERYYRSQHSHRPEELDAYRSAVRRRQGARMLRDALDGDASQG